MKFVSNTSVPYVVTIALTGRLQVDDEPDVNAAGQFFSRLRQSRVSRFKDQLMWSSFCSRNQLMPQMSRSLSITKRLNWKRHLKKKRMSTKYIMREKSQKFGLAHVSPTATNARYSENGDHNISNNTDLYHTVGFSTTMTTYNYCMQLASALRCCSRNGTLLHQLTTMLWLARRRHQYIVGKCYLHGHTLSTWMYVYIQHACQWLGAAARIPPTWLSIPPTWLSISPTWLSIPPTWLSIPPTWLSRHTVPDCCIPPCCPRGTEAAALAVWRTSGVSLYRSVWVPATAPAHYCSLPLAAEKYPSVFRI